MDQIHIRQLKLNVRVGVDPAERENPQPLIADLTLHLDLQKAGESDQLNDTVDYAELVKSVRAAAEGSCFQLVEKFAQHIAGLCLSNRKVALVDVTLTKSGALPGVGVAVTLRRSR